MTAVGGGKKGKGGEKEDIGVDARNQTLKKEPVSLILFKHKSGKGKKKKGERRAVVVLLGGKAANLANFFLRAFTARRRKKKKR